MDNLILNLLSHVSWHTLIVSDLPFTPCQLSMGYPWVWKDTQTLGRLQKLPQWKFFRRQYLEIRLNFLSTVWLLLCCASSRKRNNVVVLDLRLPSVRTEAALLPIWHWQLGPKCNSLQRFPSLPWHCSALCLVLYLHFYDYLIHMNCFFTHLRNIESYTNKIIWDIIGFIHIITANHGLRQNNPHLCCS